MVATVVVLAGPTVIPQAVLLGVCMVGIVLAAGFGALASWWASGRTKKRIAAVLSAIFVVAVYTTLVGGDVCWAWDSWVQWICQVFV